MKPWPFGSDPTLAEFLIRIKRLEDEQWPAMPLCSEGVCEEAVADLLPSDPPKGNGTPWTTHCEKVEQAIRWCLEAGYLEEVPYSGPSRGIALTGLARGTYHLDPPGGRWPRRARILLAVGLRAGVGVVAKRLDPREET